MIKEELTNTYIPDNARYHRMEYNKCGNSGLLLPKISLGLWQNFGDLNNQHTAKAILHAAFDQGITHFDLANNYGPPYGSAERNFGHMFKQDFSYHRDEIIISSKAGYDMWAGPYGIGGSRKHIIASCDQSLLRTKLDYFDIFYHHCEDASTPLEETAAALATLVHSGKALYIGISNYSLAQTREINDLLKSLGVNLLVNQVKYNLFDRSIEKELAPSLLAQKIGCVAYSPLAQGILTEKYLTSIPENSRAANPESLYLNASDLSQDKLIVINKLNELAQSRQQSLAQMALAWVLNHKAISSCIVGASNVKQLNDSLGALQKTEFSSEELEHINSILPLNS